MRIAAHLRVVVAGSEHEQWSTDRVETLRELAHLVTGGVDFGRHVKHPSIRLHVDQVGEHGTEYLGVSARLVAAPVA